jgi:IclR family pca regulon transcriptional regulator
MPSLARGLAAIRLPRRRVAASVADVARPPGCRASARRCLHTLSALGYATASGGRYATPAILAGQAYCRRRASPAWPSRCSSAYPTSYESSSVAVLDGEEITHRARGRPSHPRDQPRVGKPPPAACTSMGRVLLAAAGDADDRAVSSGVKLPRSPPAITDKPALAAESEAVRAQGY